MSTFNNSNITGAFSNSSVNSFTGSGGSGNKKSTNAIPSSATPPLNIGTSTSSGYSKMKPIMKNKTMTVYAPPKPFQWRIKSK